MAPPLQIGSLRLSNNLILAPMASITNLPMRLLARRCGAGLCFTEMISVNGLVRDGRKTFELMRSTPEDRPLGIQLFGDDPELLVRGARLAEPHGDLIDINMGCPVKKVVGSGAGSALLRDPAKAGEIIRAVRKATHLPLTIKLRTGWNGEDATFLEIARIAAAEGCDAITLHPRSRSQMFEGHADWRRIEELKAESTLPVIGSGDIFSAGDVISMLEQTGCDGVMVARGGLGNPWIFREALQLLAGNEAVPPTAAERLSVALAHLELFTSLCGERVAVREMRKHLSWYAKGLSAAAVFRAAVNGIDSAAAMRSAAEEFFGTHR